MNNIRIHAKEWFDKANGNSYFSARIQIDGKEVAILPFQYGYGSHYIDIAAEWLANNNYIYLPKHKNGSRESLWSHCRSNNVELFTTKKERSLKRELDKREVTAWNLFN